MITDHANELANLFGLAPTPDEPVLAYKDYAFDYYNDAALIGIRFEVTATSKEDAVKQVEDILNNFHDIPVEIASNKTIEFYTYVEHIDVADYIELA